LNKCSLVTCVFATLRAFYIVDEKKKHLLQTANYSSAQKDHWGPYSNDRFAGIIELLPPALAVLQRQLSDSPAVPASMEGSVRSTRGVRAQRNRAV